METETDLRNKFAMSAVAGLANTFIDADDLADRAWSIADAMIRKQPVCTEVKSLEKIPNKSEVVRLEVVPKKSKASMKFPDDNPKKKDVSSEQSKDGLLAFLDDKGKDSRHIHSEFEKAHRKKISYSAIMYRLNELLKKGHVSVNKSNKPYLWTRNLDQSSVVQLQNFEDVDSAKLEFASARGFENVTEAVKALGPFEFSEAFETWKSPAVQK